MTGASVIGRRRHSLVLATLFVLALATAVPAHAQTAPAPAPSSAEIAKLEADVVRLGAKTARWGYSANELCGYEESYSLLACRELAEAKARLKAAKTAAADQ